MSDYNMSHTGEQLDDAITKVQNGYIMPKGTKAINENGTHNVAEYESVNVAVPTGENAVQEIMVVSAEFNFGTGQAENFSHAYAEIVQAFNAGKAVKLIANYLGDGDLYQYAIGDLIHYREDEKVLEFAVFLYSNILTVDHKLHHFRIVMNENNTTETTIEVLGSGGENNNNSEEVQEVIILTADFDLQTLDISNLSHTYAQIKSALLSGKIVKIKLAIIGVMLTTTYVYGEVMSYSETLGFDNNAIKFKIIIKDNFGDGELIYLNTMSLLYNDTADVSLSVLNTTTG